MTVSFTLVWNILILALLLGAQVGSRSITHGIKYALSNLDSPPGESRSEARLRRVKNNQLEFIVLLVSVLSLASMTGGIGEVPGWIPIAIISGRTAYVLVALAGVPVLRSATWIVAFVAWIFLALPPITSSI